LHNQGDQAANAIVAIASQRTTEAVSREVGPRRSELDPVEFDWGACGLQSSASPEDMIPSKCRTPNGTNLPPHVRLRKTHHGTNPAPPIASGNQPLYFVHHASAVKSPAATVDHRPPSVNALQMKYTASNSQKQRITSVSDVRL